MVSRAWLRVHSPTTCDRTGRPIAARAACAWKRTACSRPDRLAAHPEEPSANQISIPPPARSPTTQTPSAGQVPVAVNRDTGQRWPTLRRAYGCPRRETKLNSPALTRTSTVGSVASLCLPVSRDGGMALWRTDPTLAACATAHGHTGRTILAHAPYDWKSTATPCFPSADNLALFAFARLTAAVQPLGGCGVSTPTRQPTPMRVRNLKSAPISQVGCNCWLAGLLAVSLLHVLNERHCSTQDQG